MTQELVRVQSVEPREKHTVNIRFTDGSSREVDLSPYLRGPIFKPIRNDPAQFHAMQIEEGSIAWPNGADIDPDVLYYGLTPAWVVAREKRFTYIYEGISLILSTFLFISPWVLGFAALRSAAVTAWTFGLVWFFTVIGRFVIRASIRLQNRGWQFYVRNENGPQGRDAIGH